jgi:hypothetical protein
MIYLTASGGGERKLGLGWRMWDEVQVEQNSNQYVHQGVFPWTCNHATECLLICCMARMIRDEASSRVVRAQQRYKAGAKLEQTTLKLSRIKRTYAVRQPSVGFGRASKRGSWTALNSAGLHMHSNANAA